MRHALRARWRWIPALVTLVILAPAISPAAVAWQVDTEPPVTELAAPPVLEQAWSFLGRSETLADQVTAAGWLISVSGLDPSELTAATGDETAPRSRFTFVADIAIARTSSRGAAVTTFGQGTLTIYLHEGTTPNEADLSSFRSETIVAAYAAEFQDTAQRQTPELGVVTGRMSLVQTEALTFTLNEERFRFGHAGAELALTYAGGLAPNTADSPTTGASYFGAAKVSHRSANPTDTGAATAGGGELSECEQLAVWVKATTDRLLAAYEPRTEILSGGDLAQDDLAAAFATVSALADEQRADPGPEPAAGAARLALIALSTDARGLELLVSAASSGDQAAISQALAILADGEGLATRALDTLIEITPTCDPSS